MRRPTEHEPTLSGLVGIIANALGRTRSDDVSDLAAMRLGVRCDVEGVTVRDYHTAGAGPYPRDSSHFPAGIIQADGKLDQPSHRFLPTDRFMLSDGAFLCALEGPSALLAEADDALRHPARPLFLGRRACPPSRPLVADGDPHSGLRADWVLEDALAAAPLLRKPASRNSGLVRVVVSAAHDEPWDRAVRDRPVGPAFADRTFEERRLRTLFLETDGGTPFRWVDPHDALDLWIPGGVLV